MKQFPKENINPPVCKGSFYWFGVAMISSCKPVFDKCFDNYQVEDALREAGVILPETETDTESCCLVVLFPTRKAGEAFIDRLNTYLKLKAPYEPKES